MGLKSDGLAVKFCTTLWTVPLSGLTAMASDETLAANSSMRVTGAAISAIIRGVNRRLAAVSPGGGTRRALTEVEAKAGPAQVGRQCTTPSASTNLLLGGGSSVLWIEPSEGTQAEFANPVSRPIRNAEGPATEYR